jgi:hypothetical protein
MAIHSIEEIIIKVIEEETKKIEEFFPKITHAPTIGKQYEDATIKALKAAIPDKYNLQVVSGFIRNSEGKLSDQIDCMVVKGEGQLIPPMDKEFVYHIRDVLAVIEVKKNLFSGELKDAYEHYLKIKDLKVEFEDLPGDLSRSIYKTFATATGILIRSFDEVRKIQNPLYYNIFHGLVAQFILPLRIIIGYDGFSSERSLRSKFVKYLSKNIYKKGFGPFSFPDLIICGENCLLKLTGEPYSPIIVDDFYEFFVSSNNHNIRILSELVASRISRFHPIDFTGDDTNEPLNPFLGAKFKEVAGKQGWEYNFHDENLKNNTPSEEWSPLFVEKDVFDIFTILCQTPINVNHTIIRNFKSKNPEIINHLIATHFVGIHNEILYLITTSIKTCMLPDGTYAIGEDNYGYFSKWIIKSLNM